MFYLQQLLVYMLVCVRNHLKFDLDYFFVERFVSVSRNKKASEHAINICCSVDLDMGIYSIIGIPPICEDSPENVSGEASENSFESSIAQIRESDLTKFLDGLTVLLR